MGATEQTKQVNGGAEAGRRLTKCMAIDQFVRTMVHGDGGAEGYTMDQRGGQMGEMREGWIGE